MPRGQPDYGMYQQKSTGATLADMGDLAVRLGSIVEYDRRGDIVCLDDFEGPLIKWALTLAGGATIILDNTSVKSGAQAVKLTSGIGALNAAQLGKRLQPLGTRKIGGEISFSVPDADNIFAMGLYYDDAVTRLWGAVNINFSTNVVAIRSTLDPIFTYPAFLSSNHTYYPVKLVVDFIAGYYSRLLFGDTEYDLSAYALEDIGTAGIPEYNASIALTNVVAAVNNSLWVDDFILTQNEP